MYYRRLFFCAVFPVGIAIRLRIHLASLARSITLLNIGQYIEMSNLVRETIVSFFKRSEVGEDLQAIVAVHVFVFSKYRVFHNMWYPQKL